MTEANNTEKEQRAISLQLSGEALAQLIEQISEHVLAKLAENGQQSGWPEWMSVETAAAYLDVSAERVRKLQARSEIPYYQEAPNCRVFFRRQELDQWMRAFLHPARRPTPL